MAAAGVAQSKRPLLLQQKNTPFWLVLVDQMVYQTVAQVVRVVRRKFVMRIAPLTIMPRAAQVAGVAAVLYLTGATVQQVAAAEVAAGDSAAEQRKVQVVQPSQVKLALPETTSAAAAVVEWEAPGTSAKAVLIISVALAAPIQALFLEPEHPQRMQAAAAAVVFVPAASAVPAASLVEAVRRRQRWQQRG